MLPLNVDDASSIATLHSEYNIIIIPIRSLSMPITLDGSSLTIEKLVAIARDNEKIELAPEALERIKVCRLMLEEKLANKEIMYGTNTGIGEFSETMLNDEQVKEFQ